jgi:glycosyltransferase involved in cell wall biosynthesis
LLITDLEIGGTPTVVRELAVRLNDPRSVEVQVVCLSRAGPVADQLARAGIKVTACTARNPAALPIVAWKLARHIRQQRIDTVLSFLIHANVVAAIASHVTKGVHWFQSIQTTQPRPRWHWRLQGIAQSAAGRIVVPSASVARVAQEWSHIPSEKIVVIPNAVTCGTGGSPVVLEPKQDTGGRFDSSHQSPPMPLNLRRIAFVGRLDPIKRIPDLVQAMSLLDSSFRLDIYGEGSERKKIEIEIGRMNLAGRITLHGAIARPDDALKNADVLALPSEAEGFGLVLIEAMAAGVPVVATDVPGICDVVRNRETGLLVPVGKPQAMAEAIRSLMADPVRRNRLVGAAQEEVRTRYSWDVVLPQYRAILGLA